MTLDDYVRSTARARAAAISARLELAYRRGESAVVFPDLRPGVGQVVYWLPTWRRNPIQRFRLWRFMRSA